MSPTKLILQHRLERAIEALREIRDIPRGPEDGTTDGSYPYRFGKAGGIAEAALWNLEDRK